MKPHDHKYFDELHREWLPIPGMCYAVSLPIAQDIPALADNPLMAHRSVEPSPPPARRWVVAHRDTSAIVAHGNTRADAIRNAQTRLLQLGNDVFVLAVTRCKANILALQAGASRSN